MAAIINFPQEAAFWRRHNSRTPPENGEGAKIIIFSGVRYSRKKSRQPASRSVTPRKEEAGA